MKTRTKFALILALLAAGSSASFAQVTGDPGTDSGWTAATSTLLFEDAAFSANYYTTTFNLAAGSSLLGTGQGWNVGDTIIGVGGVFNSAASISYSGNFVTTRFVIKYGTSSEAWTAGSSGGAAAALGGTGTIELGTSTDVLSASSGLEAPANTPEEITGPSSTAVISDDVGQIITSWNGSGPGTIVGFEEYLDLSLLHTQVPSEGVTTTTPMIVDLQIGSGNFTDTLVTVPEPSTLALLAAGLILPFGSKIRRTLGKK